MRDLAFLDLETTGLDPSKHEIIEAAVVRVDGRTLEERAAVSVRIAPMLIGSADPEALRINGFDADTWNGSPITEALPRVIPLLGDATLAGHNVARFDLTFMLAACNALGLAMPRSKYVLDVASLCWPLLVRGEVESLSLAALCSHFGISNDGAHGSLADCRRALAVARAVILGGAS